MTCAITDREQRLDDFLLRKLSEPEAEAFEIHVFGCAECLQELRMREQMITLMQEERAVATQTTRVQSRAGVVRAITDFFSLRPNAWIYAGAAVALLVAILASPLFRGQDAAENYATNFAPSPQLESLIGQAQRSSRFTVAVFSPRSGENFTGEVVFHWQIKQGGEEVAEPMTLKILNNLETLIHSASVAGKEYRLRERLAPGLYYWTLEHKEGTAHVGKFFFKSHR